MTMTKTGHRNGITLISLLVASSTFTHASFADGFSSSQPFSLRFDAALSRYGNYGDVLGAGGASAGSTFSSSANPASSAVRGQKPGGSQYRPLTLSPQRTSIEFDNGHDLDLSILGGTYRINNHQKLEFGIAQVESSSATRNGDPTGSQFQLEADLYTLGWSSAFGSRNSCKEPTHFFGVDYSVRDTDSQLGFGTVNAVTDSTDSSGINIGYLYHTKVGGNAKDGDSECVGDSSRNNLALGAVLTLGDSDTSRTSIVSTSGESDSSSRSIRLGAGLRVGQGRYLYSDIQYGRYKNTNPSGDSDNLNVTRLFAGIQWQIPENPGNGFRLYLRGGIVIDDEGNQSNTLGIGTIAHSGNTFRVGVDLGYQRNMFPELEPEFGDSELINLSLRFKFKS